MQTLDYAVLVAYFVGMVVIGLLCMRLVKRQEDFFMGGRSFGKLLQTFAAFGSGTGANDPIQVGRTTWTSGLSGIWSVLLFLFVTPFYWIVSVWYRRMRHVTLGDWFVERYESKGLGAAYTLFGFAYYMMYLSTAFTAISKVAESIVGFDQVQLWGMEEPVGLAYVLVPGIALLVIIYGVLGGLRAAYWTDLIQGICIIVLSVILVPYGLIQLAHEHGDEQTQTIQEEHGESSMEVAVDGFRILHKQVPESYFQIYGGPRSGEFPLHYIVSLTLLALIGVVVQPHFIATAGGSAKTENSARLGMVTGNFLKRLCTIGWALTGLILLALMADNPDVMRDPDRTWGIATRTILGPIGLGLVGLMLACLLAALMSSADCYMIMTSGLVVRNIYAAYIDPDASEKTYVLAGRIASLFVIAGAALVSLYLMDVFGQFKIALEFCTLFAAPFWIGMYWRTANKWAAWLTIAFSISVFFAIPILAPVVAPQLCRNPEFTITNNIVTTQVNRLATETDKEKRDAEIKIWEQSTAEYERAVQDYRSANEAAAIPLEVDDELPSDETFKRLELATGRLLAARSERDKQGDCPQPIRIGAPFVEEFRTGGKAIFWNEGVKAAGKVEMEELERREEGDTVTVVQRQSGELEGFGRFNLDYLVYQAVGMDLTQMDNAMLETLRLPPRLITPFLVMILLSLILPRNSQQALDRYYVKMKTPVSPDPEEDRQELRASYADPSRFDHKKLFRGSNLEIQIPTWADVLGVVVCFGVCFVFIALLVWLAGIGRGV